MTMGPRARISPNAEACDELMHFRGDGRGGGDHHPGVIESELGADARQNQPVGEFNSHVRELLSLARPHSQAPD